MKSACCGDWSPQDGLCAQLFPNKRRRTPADFLQPNWSSGEAIARYKTGYRNEFLTAVRA
jgi:hypothetical protein